MANPEWDNYRALTILDSVGIEMRRQLRLKAAGKFKETAEDMAQRGALLEAHAVLSEEVGEVARALNDNESLMALREELIQVAAVACSFVKGIDCTLATAQAEG